jgi:hypothetical protein
VHPAPTTPAGRYHDAADRCREAQHEHGEQQCVVGPRSVSVLCGLLGILVVTLSVRTRLCRRVLL